MSVPANAVQAQGVGSVSADQANTFVQGALNYAALKAFTGIGGMLALMQGSATVGDGGQGIFVWNPESASPDDGGATTIIPTGSTSGAWNRLVLTGGGSGGSIPLSALQAIAALTILGNNTAGSGPVLQLTPAQIAAMLPAVVGDTGTGGTKGLVPAPPAGSAAAGKVLGANGTWVAQGGVGAQFYAPDTGVVNAMAATLPSGPTAYAAGLIALIKVAYANTGGTTLALNGLAPQTVKFAGSPLAAGAVQPGLIYLFVYDGTAFQLVAGPASSRSGSGSITLPSATAATGTVGSSGYYQGANTITQWAYIQLQDNNSDAATTWTYPIAFPTAVIQIRTQNFALMAGQASAPNVDPKSAVCSVVSASTTAAGFCISNTGTSGTKAVFMVEAVGY